jgi:hypothetical protein
LPQAEILKKQFPLEINLFFALEVLLVTLAEASFYSLGSLLV